MMENSYIRNDGSTYQKLEVVAAELYLFFLPFRQITQLSFLKTIVGASVDWFPSIFHGIGLLLWLISANGTFNIHDEKRGLFRYALALVIYLNVSSFIMAIIMQLTYGNQGSENAFQGVMGMELYFFQYFLMFLYNYRVFQIISIDRLKKILGWCCRTLLVIGYFQILVMNGIGGELYNKLNIFGFLSSSLPKVCLTGSEGASAGCIMSLFVFPYLYSRIVSLFSGIAISHLFIVISFTVLMMGHTFSQR